MSDNHVTWQQRCYPRREQRSWHWYAHGVNALEGNEGVPSPYRGTYEQDPSVAIIRRGVDWDPTRGSTDARVHRSNAAIGAAYRARARRAARP